MANLHQAGSEPGAVSLTSLDTWLHNALLLFAG